MSLLKGKTAVITGAARGIGREIAIAMAKEGANIAFTDLKIDENMQSLEKELKSMGINAKGFAVEYQMSIRALKLGHKIKEIPTIEKKPNSFTMTTGLKTKEPNPAAVVRQAKRQGKKT